MMYMLTKMLTLLMAWISTLSYPSTPIQSTEVIDSLPTVVQEEPTVVQEEYVPPYDNFYVEGKINVRIIHTDDPYDYYAIKKAVDDPNTGGSMQYYSALWIGDHNNQGFSMLPSVQVGDLAQWHGNQYICYDADDYAWIDENQQIRCYDGSYLSDKDTIVTCTCKTDTTRYLRYWKLA